MSSHQRSRVSAEQPAEPSTTSAAQEHDEMLITTATERRQPRSKSCGCKTLTKANSNRASRYKPKSIAQLRESVMPLPQMAISVQKLPQRSAEFLWGPTGNAFCVKERQNIFHPMQRTEVKWLRFAELLLDKHSIGLRMPFGVECVTIRRSVTSEWTKLSGTI